MPSDTMTTQPWSGSGIERRELAAAVLRGHATASVFQADLRSVNRKFSIEARDQTVAEIKGKLRSVRTQDRFFPASDRVRGQVVGAVWGGERLLLALERSLGVTSWVSAVGR